MGESFQDYSWIQDFEADFPQKVSLKILNQTDFNSFSELFSVHLLAIDHLLLKLLTLCRHTASFKIWISKIQDFLNFELSPMLLALNTMNPLIGCDNRIFLWVDKGSGQTLGLHFRKVDVHSCLMDNFI